MLTPLPELNVWQQFFVVALRFGIGWHMFYQGLGKLLAVRWSAAGYLAVATGPLAPFFHWLASKPALLRVCDLATMWGLTILGALLMLGLLTRTASLFGFALLMLFFLAQPPLSAHGFAVTTRDGSELYVNKVLIEAWALLACMVLNSGRISGLDMIVGPWLKGIRSGKGGARSVVRES